ncbi:hypothetical protein BC828DRAFT_383276 [Blastocladiella britannica]|nr:hypothetical protein BC828DRAFT_383276 [Blastocladiella britannica]
MRSTTTLAARLAPRASPLLRAAVSVRLIASRRRYASSASASTHLAPPSSATSAPTAAKAEVNPISLGEFSRMLAAVPISPTEKLVVAVSGGSDSMALAMLLHKYAPGRVHAVIVDHGLRPESATEAARVASQLQAAGIPATVETVQWGEAAGTVPLAEMPAAQIEERARIQRYRALGAACRRLGARLLFMGHHADDQAETIVYRLARSSGLGGLRGMVANMGEFPVVVHPRDADLRVVRPFLAVPKTRLVASCERLGVNVVHDPMNDDPRFQRNVLRAVLADVKAKSTSDPNASGLLTTERMSAFCEHLREYADAANLATNQAIAESVITDEQTGTAFICLPHLAREPTHWFHRTHLATHVVSTVMRWVGNLAYAPHLGGVAKVRDTMREYYMRGPTPPPAQNQFKSMSMASCLVIPPRPDPRSRSTTKTPSTYGPGNWVVVRSPPLAKTRHEEVYPLSVDAAVPPLFDNRFFVALKAPDVKPEIAPRIGMSRFYASLVHHLPAAFVRDGGGYKVAHLVRGTSAAIDKAKADAKPGVKKPALEKPQFELVVRFFDAQDEGALANVFRTRHQHAAWAEYRRAIEHYRSKMPLVARYVIPVVALRRIKDTPTSSSSATATTAVAKNRFLSPTKANVDTPLGALVAIPCLGVNFMPDVFAVETEFRGRLFKCMSTGIKDTDLVE